MTKNKFFCGMLAIALTFGMMVLGCDTGGNGGGNGNGNGPDPDPDITYTVVSPGGPIHPGRNMELRGRVYRFNINNFTFPRYFGNRDIVSVIFDGNGNPVSAGTGTITNGQVLFNMRAPSVLVPVTVLFHGVSVTPANTRLNRLDLTAGGEMLGRARVQHSPGASGSGTFISEDILFLYANQNASLSHPGATESQVSGGVTITEIYNPFNINLQAGWNLMELHMEITYTPTTEDITFTMSLGNPANVHWLLADPAVLFSAQAQDIMPLSQLKGLPNRPPMLKMFRSR